MVTQLQALRQLGDGNVIAAGESFDGQQSLVLLRRQAGLSSDTFARAQELAQRRAKLGHRDDFGRREGQGH